MLPVKFYPFALSVDGFVAIFGVAFVERIEPEEERCALHAIEFNQVAYEMSVDDGTLYTAEKVLLKYFLCFLGMAHIAYILFVHGMEVAAFYPALAERGILQCTLHTLVGVYDKALGVWDIAPYEYAGHAFACAVLDAVA